MESTDSLREFLGWCTVINMGFLLIAALAVSALRDFMMSVHRRMYRLSDDDLGRAYFQYLAQYKIAVFVFNLVPYMALRVMG